MPFYLKPKKHDFNQIPELQICIAEALYDVESVLADPSVFSEQELMRLRDQIGDFQYMTLIERINANLLAAMKSKDEDRLRAIRLLRAAVLKEAKDNKREPDDELAITITSRLVKQGKESISAFSKAEAGRGIVR